MPLSSSLYVKGKLADREKVLVDVGTGFYVEKVRWRATYEAQEETGIDGQRLIWYTFRFLKPDEIESHGVLQCQSGRTGYKHARFR